MSISAPLTKTKMKTEIKTEPYLPEPKDSQKLNNCVNVGDDILKKAVVKPEEAVVKREDLDLDVSNGQVLVEDPIDQNYGDGVDIDQEDLSPRKRIKLVCHKCFLPLENVQDEELCQCQDSDQVVQQKQQKFITIKQEESPSPSPYYDDALPVIVENRYQEQEAPQVEVKAEDVSKSDPKLLWNNRRRPKNKKREIEKNILISHIISALEKLQNGGTPVEIHDCIAKNYPAESTIGKKFSFKRTILVLSRISSSIIKSEENCFLNHTDQISKSQLPYSRTLLYSLIGQTSILQIYKKYIISALTQLNQVGNITDIYHKIIEMDSNFDQGKDSDEICRRIYKILRKFPVTFTMVNYDTYKLS